MKYLLLLSLFLSGCMTNKICNYGGIVVIDQTKTVNTKPSIDANGNDVKGLPGV